MNWLQISDLHIKNSTEWEMMKKSYQNVLKETTIDFIVLTGDVHNYDDDYDETKVFLNHLIEMCGITDKSNLIITLGNHDSKDFETKVPITESIRNHIDKSPDYYLDYIDRLMASYKTYMSFHRDFFKEEDYIVENISVKNYENKINIININTSLISDGTDNFQIIDINKLSKLEINNNQPTIAVGHYPLDLIHETHRQIMLRVFTELNVSAYLCGHTHKKDSLPIVNFSTSNKTIPCIVCGKSAIDTEDEYSDNGFYIYEYNEEKSKVFIKVYKWNKNKKKFTLSNELNADDGEFTFNLIKRNNGSSNNSKKSTNTPRRECNVLNDIITYKGHQLIGNGNNGIKYFWNKGAYFVESVAFNQRNDISRASKTSDLSAYTTSISKGCVLKADNTQCLFCNTGKRAFKGYLTAEDIALQNIFMTNYDISCEDRPELKNNSREFAYMGHGEPGHAYHLIRESILLTDYAMAEMKQKVYKYIISTCGIDGFIPLLINDMATKMFENKVTISFSLNATGSDRNALMPINRNYPYMKFIESCEDLYNLTNEKISVSMIVFNDFPITGDRGKKKYSLTEKTLENALAHLNPNIFKINLRTFNSNNSSNNNNDVLGTANKLLNVVKNNCFEGKISSSYGEKEGAALGMLKKSTTTNMVPTETGMRHYDDSIKLLEEAKKKIKKNNF